MAITDFFLTLKVFYFAIFVSAVVLWRRRSKTRTKKVVDRRFVLTLLSFFVFIYLLNVPVVFGRCPGYNTLPTYNTAYGGLTGLYLGVTSGLVTFLSPCGLPALPAYIRYFLGAKASRERTISLSFLATSGFLFALATFSVAFVLLRDYFVTSLRYSSGSPIGIERIGYGSLVISYSIPSTLDLLGYIAGAVSIVMGVLMLLRIKLPFFRPRTLGSFNRGVRSVFLFSLGWGVASIACSPYAIIPLLLYALVEGGLTPFLGFAAGMVMPVLLVSLLLGSGRIGVVERMVRVSTKYYRFAGVLLAATGIYIIVYTFLNPSAGGTYLFGS